VAEEGRGLPGVDLGGDGRREVGALVDNPADGAGDGWWREEAGAQGRVGTRAAEDVADGGPRRGEFNFVWAVG
jgi:hypothetical protein